MREGIERVVLAPEDHAVVIREPSGSPTEIVKDAPANLVDDYRQAVAALAGARAALVTAAGYDPDTVWQNLLDEQAVLLERWIAAGDPPEGASSDTEGPGRRQGKPAAVDQAVDLLGRAVSAMAANAESAEQAGLAGDGRRWWTVRHDVLRALTLLYDDPVDATMPAAPATGDDEPLPEPEPLDREV